MHRTYRPAASLAASLVALACSLPASTSNGAVHSFFEFSDLAFAGTCAGEPVDFHWTVHQVRQQLVTPSGREHLVDHFLMGGVAVGTESGREWSLQQSTSSPFTQNSGPGADMFTFVFTVVMQPITEGAPMMHARAQGHITTNANGIETATVEKIANWRCIVRK